MARTTTDYIMTLRNDSSDRLREIRSRQPVSGIPDNDEFGIGLPEGAALAENDWRRLIDELETPLFELDLRGRFLQVNEAMGRVLGRLPGALSGVGLRRCLAAGTEKKVFADLTRVFRSGTPAICQEWEIVQDDGVRRFLEVSVTLIRNGRGEATGFRGMARDVTRWRVVESQLAQAQMLETIGQLAAGIAHEINTPLQYVSDNMYFLKDAFGEILDLLETFEELLSSARSGHVPGEIVEKVSAAVQTADLDYLREESPLAITQSLEGLARVSKIVRAMKSFSHPGAAEKQLLDVNKAIDSTVCVAKNEWKYAARLETDFEENLPRIPGFAAEFNQVILNLIVNAVHAVSDVVGEGTNGKGDIRITTRRDGDWVEIRVADTGSGIPEAVRSKIFDPFFTTKEIGKGTGQGLSLAHSVIVGMHGGKIGFETELGKGTTFTIRLPMEDPSQP